MALLQQLESDAIQGVIALSQANETAIVAGISAGEAWVAPMFANLLKQIPSIKGIYGMIANPLLADFESFITGQVTTLLAKYNAQELFNLYIALLQHLATLVPATALVSMSANIGSVSAAVPKLGLPPLS